MNKPIIFAFNYLPWKVYLPFQISQADSACSPCRFILVLYFTLGGRIVLPTAHDEQIKKQKMVNDVYLPSVNNSCFLNQLPYLCNSVKLISMQVEFICRVFKDGGKKKAPFFVKTAWLNKKLQNIL